MIGVAHNQRPDVTVAFAHNRHEYFILNALCILILINGNEAEQIAQYFPDGRLADDKIASVLKDHFKVDFSAGIQFVEIL
ncbi:hypothetical protein MYSE111917_15795 [Mycobacterium senriense]|uniref:Uncharacterized protein n=1 Tax=Mycobacterium senriense TaxID=2775496 RepID=A0ABM7SSK5_9MYCO|nr:hypothetical protein MTY59_06160 [Mycobacterium senriense]